MERQSPKNLKAGPRLLDLVDESEGNVLYAYDDADRKATKTPITAANAHTIEGTLTIGRGHTRGVYPGQTCTEEESRAWFYEDLAQAEALTRSTVHVPLHQHEYEAVTDLYFNVGPGRRRGTFGPEDKGKDGIACLGKSYEDGRPSTLLRTLNGGDYDAAAVCFTQWRMPNSIFEWGLLKRRIRGMLLFKGLPWMRAQNAFPNVMPHGAALRIQFVEQCTRLACEERDDLEALKPKGPPPAEPAKPPQPSATAPVVAEAVRPGPVAAEPPVPAPAPKPAPAPPPPRPKPTISPRSVDINAIPYGEVSVENGAKLMTRSQRVIGLVIVAIGSVFQILAARDIFSSMFGAVFFDLSRDPAIIALITGGVLWIGSKVVIRHGTKVVTKGMVEAKQVLV